MNNHVSYGFLEILLKSWGSSFLFLCCVLCLVIQSCQTFFATLWTVAHQAPLVGLEYWNGLPCPPPGDLSDPGIKPRSPPLQVNSLPSEPQGSPRILEYSTLFGTIIQFRYIAWRRQWQQTPVLLPGKSHGWRSLVHCSPWGRKESDTTEWLHFHFSLSCIGEGNGNPLQHSCLESPRDGGAWWAAISGVTQSRTRLKWHSISSSIECTNRH